MIAYAALSPHPPLIVPEIGGSRLKEVQSTVDGMQQMARELAASSPETIVFLTPHGNVFADALSSLGQPILKGDLANFGARQKWQVSNDLELLREIAAQSDRKSTRLNSSHSSISYAVFCLKKKKKGAMNNGYTRTFHGHYFRQCQCFVGQGGRPGQND